MSKLVQKINFMSDSGATGGPYSFLIPLFDPNRNITYSATLPQALSQLFWLFEEGSAGSISFLRANY